MRNLRSASTGTFTLALLMNCGMTGWSQEKGVGIARELRSTDFPTIRVMTPQENDHRIARWLTIDNRMIFDCAKLGKERAERADVRQFADTLVTAHQKYLDELNVLAGKKVAHDRSADASKNVAGETDTKIRNPSNEAATGLGDTSPSRSRTAILVHDYGSSRDSRVVFHPTDFLAVREEIYDHLSETAKKEMEGLNGAEFDRAFLKHQIMAHELLVATIQAIRPTASTEMQLAIDRELPKWKVHLQRARNLADPNAKTTGSFFDRRNIHSPVISVINK